eukprot:1143032-Pelagomonas_calceolata.AAC.3
MQLSTSEQSMQDEELACHTCFFGLQETPVSKGGTHQYIFFDTTVYLQTAINRLPSGSAIFFEFKHWKEKEKKVWGSSLSASTLLFGGADIKFSNQGGPFPSLV